MRARKHHTTSISHPHHPPHKQSAVYGALFRCTGSLLLTSHRLVFLSDRRKPSTQVRRLSCDLIASW